MITLLIIFATVFAPVSVMHNQNTYMAAKIESDARDYQNRVAYRLQVIKMKAIHCDFGA